MISLSRCHSEVIKGILIVLIVFGHNHILCPNTVKGGLMDYLYQFHVAGFFILPFFYQGNTTISWERICNIIVRNWIPYLWICIVCWIVYSLLRDEFVFGWSHVFAFINGTQTPIKNYFGFVFPWFLPTYCSFSILLLLARNKKWFYGICLVIGIGTFLMTWDQFYDFKNSIPFGIGLALHYFASGAIAFAIVRYIKYGKYIGSIVFVALSVCWWMKMPLDILYHFVPATFFLLLLCITPFMDFDWIRLLGKYSLGIYLIHVFILNFIFQCFPHTLLWGWGALFIAIGLSLLFAISINKVERIRKFLFPHDFEDLRL